MAALIHRWGPPAVGVVFATGLQLSGVVQHALGWVLICIAVIGAVIYVLVDRRHSEEGGEPGSAFARAKNVERLEIEENVSTAETFYLPDGGSHHSIRKNVHKPHEQRRVRRGDEEEGRPEERGPA